MNIFKNAAELIGNTPLVEINMNNNSETTILVKLEMFNPGSSVKDRIAYSMIKEAEDAGKLTPGGTIVEPTSGNTGIGLALIGASKNYNVILTMPESMSKERRMLLKGYGAELILTPAEDGMKGAINRAEKLVNENEDYFMPQQFKNPANPEIHRKTTAQEIVTDIGEKIDYFVAGVGTGGTITGVGEVLKEENEETTIVAVEPEDSAVLSGREAGSHQIQGIGAGFVPEILNVDIIDEIVTINNQEAMKTARQMAKKEGILGGISSGAAVAASLKIAEKSPAGSVIVTIAPDSGERYLTTSLFSTD
ncbi:MAG: cysteine synthase A [Bacillota bacterium]